MLGKNVLNNTLAPGADPGFKGPKTCMIWGAVSKKNDTKEYTQN